MRKIREVLRLKWAKEESKRQIAASCGISRPSVDDYLGRALSAGLSWPLPEEMSDLHLERLLFPSPSTLTRSERGVPDWAEIYSELKRKGVTLQLLWLEYRESHPNGYQYAWFCDQYRNWLGQRDRVMRQNHRAGEKLFVDYAGHTVEIIDQHSGEVRTAQIFVAVMGASNYTFAEATWSQALPDWIGSHRRAFEFFGSVPEVVVPDNLRSGVTKAHRYEPDLNPTYQELASHYGVTVIPARVRKPKDKAKAEVGVQIVERWILAALRNHTFFTLAELNRAIRKLLIRLNERPFKKLPGTRTSQFQQFDQPAMSPLPQHPYLYAEWKRVRVHIDYHVEVDGHYYSVPHALVKRQLDARLTAGTVECFHKGERVSSHPRSHLKGRHTTCPEHMPESHRRYGEWSPERLISWAEKFGPATAKVVTAILCERRHPQQGYRSCLGILRLGKSYGSERLEAACQRALLYNTHRYKSIESILKNGLDRITIPEQQELPLPSDHDNIRGPGYYH